MQSPSQLTARAAEKTLKASLGGEQGGVLMFTEGFVALHLFIWVLG